MTELIVSVITPWLVISIRRTRSDTYSLRVRGSVDLEAGIASTLLRSEFLRGWVFPQRRPVPLKGENLQDENCRFFRHSQRAATAVQRLTAVRRRFRGVSASWPAPDLFPCSLHEAS